jgi:hypothetical protein
MSDSRTSEKLVCLCGRSEDVRMVQIRDGWGRSHVGFYAPRPMCKPCRTSNHGIWKYAYLNTPKLLDSTYFRCTLIPMPDSLAGRSKCANTTLSLTMAQISTLPEKAPTSADTAMPRSNRKNRSNCVRLAPMRLIQTMRGSEPTISTVGPMPCWMPVVKREDARETREGAPLPIRGNWRAVSGHDPSNHRRQAAALRRRIAVSRHYQGREARSGAAQ